MKPEDLEPKPPNDEGATLCTVRWMVTLPNGRWLGAWDRDAFDAYVAGRVAAEREVAKATEALRRDAERLNWIERQHLAELSMHLVVDAEHDGQYYVCGDSNTPGYGPTLRAAIDAAMGAQK